MGRSHQTTVRMRGPAILALMSLLLLNGGAQPLAGSYPKTIDDCKNANLKTEGSVSTLACGDGKTYPLGPCEDGVNLNQVDGKTTVTCGGDRPPKVTFPPCFPFCGVDKHSWPVQEHGSWPVEEHSWPVQEHGSWPVQEHGGWPVQEHGGWPVQELGGWPVQELGGWGVEQHKWYCDLLPWYLRWPCKAAFGRG